MTKIVQAWVPPMYMPRVLALLWEYMESQGGTVPDKRPPLTGWTVLDDRGGSGNYHIRFEQDTQLRIAGVKSIVGKDITVTMEDL